MSKRTSNSSVNSSIRQQTKANDEGLSQLLIVQKEQLGHIASIRERLEHAQAEKQTAEANGGGAKEAVAISDDELEIRKEKLELDKKILKVDKEILETRNAEAKAIGNLAKTVTALKTPGERLAEFGKKIKSAMDPLNVLGKMNIGGIFSRTINKEKFIRAQRAAGDTGSRAEIGERFAGAEKTSKAIKATDAKFEENRKAAGLSSSEYGQTVEGKRLLAEKGKLSEEHSKYDVRANLVRRDAGEGGVQPAPLAASEVKKSSTQQFADQGVAEEQSIEDSRLMNEQTGLLEKIEKNTRGASPEQKAQPAGEGGGLLGNMLGGGKAGAVLKGLKDFGVGMVLIAGSLWVAAKAFQEFAEVAWEDVGKGIIALGALVVAALALDKVKGNIIAGAAALGILDLAMWGMAKAMQAFNEVSWEGMAKAGVAIVGFSAAMFGLGALLSSGVGAVIFGAGVAGIAAMGVAVGILGVGLQAVGAGMDAFVEGMSKLGEIDGGNLLKVAAGLAALGPAMAVFAAGSVVAGLGNLVTGFLSGISGQKSPVDQLIEIGKSGEGVEKAGTGMEKLGGGMKAFSEIKPDTMKALNEFPWEKVTKFVAAGGSMQTDSAKVYNASKKNADDNAEAEGKKGGGGTTIVNAPVNNQTTQNQMIKSPIRNQESTQQRYMRDRFANF